jgi:hypothetical protein
MEQIAKIEWILEKVEELMFLGRGKPEEAHPFSRLGGASRHRADDRVLRLDAA